MKNRNVAVGLMLLTLSACGTRQESSTPRGLLSQSVDATTAVQVNGQSLTGGVTLKPGDTITIKVPDAPVAVTPPKPVPPAVVTPAGRWTPAASDGGSFTLSIPARVRYGVEPFWLVRDAPAGTVYCNDGLGDPAIGKAKGCEVFAEGEAQLPDTKPPRFTGPLTITKGGTYSGHWESTDPTIPAVTIKTSEPVVLENCAVRGPWHLISARWVHTRLTVRNCEGQDTSDAYAGRFVVVEGAVSLVIQKNTIRGTGGIYLNSMDTLAAENKLEVTDNRAYNISGLKTGEKDLVQFLQLNHVRNQGALIAWNRVENDPGSSVEDVINIYDSVGTEKNPILITDNLIKGAFGTPPQNVYSGGGIMTGDGDGGQIKVLRNTVIETSNYGIARAGGSNITIQGNTVLGLGKLPDGTILDGDPDAGIYSRNYSGKAFDKATVKVLDNVVGWNRPTPKQADRQWNYNLNGALESGNTDVIPTADLIAQAVAKWDAAYAAR